MKRRFSSLILYPLSLFVIAAAAYALEVPPTPTQWFTDTAGIVDQTQASQLNDKLAQFEQRSGAQFIIYVFPTVGDDAIEDFTIRCAEKWKVGNKKYDNGLILFVFVKERKVRIEVGYGLEPTITDAVSARVISEDIAPFFKQGNYNAGLNAGADHLISIIEKKEAPVRPATAPSAQPGGIDVIGILVLLFVFFFIILPILRRGGGCGGCFWPMFFMGGGGRGGGITFGGGGGGGFGGGGFGGFSGGGGSFGGGGATGGW